MLSEKPWKADATLRLCMSVLICYCTGVALVTLVIQYLLDSRADHAALFLASAGGAFALSGGALYLLARPWRVDRLLLHFVLLLVCVYGGLFLAWLAMHFRGRDGSMDNAAWRTAVAVLSFQGAALVLVRRFLREHGIGWAEAFGFKAAWRRAVLLGAAVAVVFLPFGWGLQQASFAVMNQLRLQPQEQQAVQVLRATETLSSRLVMGIAAILIAPVAEEVLFRGILYPVVKGAGFPRLALWGTSLLFGAIHLNLVSFLPLTLLALVLAWLYEKTDNLLAPIAAHSLFNGLNFAMLYLAEPLVRWFSRS